MPATVQHQIRQRRDPIEDALYLSSDAKLFLHYASSDRSVRPQINVTSNIESIHQMLAHDGYLTSSSTAANPIISPLGVRALESLYPSSGSKPPKQNARHPLAIVLVLLALGCGLFFFFTSGSNAVKSSPTSTPRTTQRASITRSPYATATPIPVVQFVGNRNTGKYHKTTCASLNDMKESNMVFLYSREEAVKHGFERCQRCYP